MPREDAAQDVDAAVGLLIPVMGAEHRVANAYEPPARYGRLGSAPLTSEQDGHDNEQPNLDAAHGQLHSRRLTRSMWGLGEYSAGGVTDKSWNLDAALQEVEPTCFQTLRRRLE